MTVDARKLISQLSATVENADHRMTPVFIFVTVPLMGVMDFVMGDRKNWDCITSSYVWELTHRPSRPFGYSSLSVLDFS